MTHNEKAPAVSHDRTGQGLNTKDNLPCPVGPVDARQAAIMPGDERLTIDSASVGRNGVVVLTIRRGDDVLAVEKIDIAKSAERDRLASRICKRNVDLDHDEIERRLLENAAALQDAPPPAEPGEPASLPEIDCTAIVRPERFITPAVSGITVSIVTEINGAPVGQWRTQLQWADGRRESQLLSRTIHLAGERQLFLHPQPGEPKPGETPGWSAESRAKWLRDGRAPDPSAIFQRICKRVAYFVDLPPEKAPGITSTIALWVMLTYVYLAWPAIPYLYIGGALGSGKSRVFEVLVRLVFRPLMSSNITGPALFRTLHNRGGVLLFDEAERLKQTSAPEMSEIVSMLAAGYKRGGRATRLEKVGDTFETVTFDVFGPKALACITGIPPVVASRSIPITMLRAAPDSEKPHRRIDGDPVAWQALRDDLHVLALEYGPIWLELAQRTDVCPPMSGRDYELWQPLLALASWLESEGANGLLKLLTGHAQATIEGGRDDQAPEFDEVLLQILTDFISDSDKPRACDILARAKEKEPELFRKWTAKGVSSHLKRYGLETNKTGGKKVYGKVALETLETIQTNYGIDLGFD